MQYTPINENDLNLLYENEKRAKRMLYVFLHVSFIGINDNERNIVIMLDMNKTRFEFDINAKLKEKFGEKTAQKAFAYEIMSIAGKYGMPFVIYSE